MIKEFIGCPCNRLLKFDVDDMLDLYFAIMRHQLEVHGEKTWKTDESFEEYVKNTRKEESNYPGKWEFKD